jgi:hypothetical protein
VCRPLRDNAELARSRSLCIPRLSPVHCPKVNRITRLLRPIAKRRIELRHLACRASTLPLSYMARSGCGTPPTTFAVAAGSSTRNPIDHLGIEPSQSRYVTPLPSQLARGLLLSGAGRIRTLIVQFWRLLFCQLNYGPVVRCWIRFGEPHSATNSRRKLDRSWGLDSNQQFERDTPA